MMVSKRGRASTAFPSITAPEKLSQLAFGGLNQEAESEGEDDEEDDDDEEKPKRASARKK
jgi:hypothetical protein